MKKHALLLSLAASTVLADTFTLGQVNVLNTPIEESPFETTVTADVIVRHSTLDISEALDNASGINADLQGGRAEETLYVRGFDSRRIGIFIDGIPVYVPYDGNIDYGRFLTGDIAQIDVSKGFSSLAYGGNTMGGVINIVTQKPTETLEGSIKAGMVFDSDASLARKTTSLNVGTRLQHFYAQLGGVYTDQNHFRLSDDFAATPYQGEGDRLRSASEDYKISFKAGYVADDASEIAIGYLNQNGRKQQPPAIDTDLSREKYWDWPYWDKETLYVNGQKNFDSSYLKAAAYYDKLQNSLYAYDDADYDTMSKNSSFKSRYDDYSYGARLEYGAEAGEHLLSVSGNYKKDVHRGYDISKTTDADTLTERYEDHTISLAIEDVYTITPRWQLLGGVSYDRKEGDYAWDSASATEKIPLGSLNALNPQAAIVFSPDPASKIRASISRKSYLTSMKDRYSRKLGTAEPNPDLQSEKATHYELSYQKNAGGLSTRVNAFFSRVDDAIENLVLDDKGTVSTKDDITQNRNIGSFDHRGAELELSYTADGLEAGGNYTYISVKNRNDDALKRNDVPRHQLFAYIEKELGYGVSLYGNMKFRKGAYELTMDNTYIANPTFTTFDLKAIYRPNPALTAEIGVKNLTDKYYAYDMAFPMPGREFFANIGYNF